MVIDQQDITGLLIAGGRATRMGEVDKGLQPFRAGTMAGHVLARLAPQVGGVGISANRNLKAYAGFQVPVWPDQLAGFQGPAAGLETGLRHCRTPYLVCVPCDAPFLPPDLVARLALALPAHDLAVAATLEAAGRLRRQPLFCLLATRLLPHLSAYLAQGGRRMDGWHQGLRVAEVVFEDAQAFRNINTLDQLQQCEID